VRLNPITLAVREFCRELAPEPAVLMVQERMWQQPVKYKVQSTTLSLNLWQTNIPALAHKEVKVSGEFTAYFPDVLLESKIIGPWEGMRLGELVYVRLNEDGSMSLLTDNL
jgi:hypothetical protein